jgi:hypothetical protein
MAEQIGPIRIVDDTTADPSVEVIQPPNALGSILRVKDCLGVTVFRVTVDGKLDPTLAASAAYVDPASGTFAADLVAALQGAGLMKAAP